MIATTQVLSPPTISKILAMAAPACEYGTYTWKTIGYILNTAYTGFLSARWESEDMSVTPSRTVIHTGFWGCGAFGGNRILMAILQALAAALADVDIVFHALDDAGVSLVEDAYNLYKNTLDSAPSVSQILDALVQRNFECRVSDGN